MTPEAMILLGLAPAPLPRRQRRFQRDDRVMITSVETTCHDLPEYIDRKGTVTLVRTAGEFSVIVELDGGPSAAFRPRELSLITAGEGPRCGCCGTVTIPPAPDRPEEQGFYCAGCGVAVENPSAIGAESCFIHRDAALIKTAVPDDDGTEREGYDLFGAPLPACPSCGGLAGTHGFIAPPDGAPGKQSCPLNPR